jgi:STE24 endopeptidase
MALVLGLVVGALVLAAIYAVIRRAPRSWWLWGTGVTALFIVFGALLSPLFVSPLFNTYQPMAQGPLRDQILAMARVHDVPARDVFVFDASRQTDRISANVSGLGPTIRISLNDNLLNRTSPEEIKAVMGHELGHYVLNHVRESIIFLSLIFLALFFLLWWLSPRLLARHGARWGVRDVSDPASLPLLAIIASVTMFLLTPLTNSLTRWNEIEADRFGLDTAREPDGMASVAMRLSEYRKLQPHPLEEAIFFTHPSGANRARMAMEWKARHLGELPPGKRTMARPAPLPPKTP